MTVGGWNKMENEKKRKKRKIVITVFLLAAATACYSLMSSGSENDLEISTASVSEEETELSGRSEETDTDGTENKGMDTDETADGKEGETESEIYVDVGGAVKTPRVVCIPEGSRVFEAIEAAGGVSEEAETKYINMAAECTDGEKIYVPDHAEMEAAQNGENTDSLFSSSADLQNGAGGTEQDGQKTVNINTATSEELQELDGIGPAMASRIIEYRQTNGAFTSVDDLENVSGIGEKTLEKLRPHVSVK